MGSKSAIQWTEASWNPLTGCTKVSAGCKNCYAERMAKRLQAMGQASYANGFKLTLHEDMLDAPLHWKKPRRIFVNSMSDLFHERVPFEFIKAVFNRMYRAHWHTYQVLTKRPEQMLKWWKWFKAEGWDDFMPSIPPHIWIGVSIENQECADKRIPLLLEMPAAVRFLSCEPLLGPIVLAQQNPDGLWPPSAPQPEQTWLPHKSWPDDYQYWQASANGIHWVICGGESGPNARPMNPDWARNIRDQCLNAGIPFFMKQMGGASDKQGDMEQLLPDLQIREYPPVEIEYGQTHPVGG